MREYFGFAQLLVLTAITAAYLLIGAAMANILLFWALPAILSSVAQCVHRFPSSG